MSTNTILKGSAVAAMTFAAMSIAASANAQSRYGNVADYESGRNCGQACVAPAPQAHTSSRYGHTAPVHVAPAPVYVNCAQMGTCAPQPMTVYTQPAPVQYQAPVQSYSQQSYQTQSYAQAPANCPAGTTAQPDGTCMQSSYSASTTYSEPTTSYGSSSYSSSTYSSGTSMPADCPAGTTAQSDGTCLQGGSSTYSAPTLPDTYDNFGSSSYSSSSYSSASSAPVNCPAGTTAQPDGTCMEGGSSSSYIGSSVELYTGDATTSSSTGTSYGYTSDGSYAATDYLPIRK